MADSNSTGGSGSVQKAICTICFEDLKPIIEDLQTLPVCGHVFHELCIQQWMEYCPAGKKPTCPVCKQSCSRHNLTRLYFLSCCDSTQISSPFLTQGFANADAKILFEEARRLEMKLAAVNTAFENQQAHLKKVDEELSTWKEKAMREELWKEEISKEKEYNEHLLDMKMKEISMKTVEIAKLQERNLALAKELASLKLATDVNLEEEDMMKLASIGHGTNTQNALDVLKKSLALRNKSYKDLMIQCNILGRSETRACKKFDKAKEKMNKLRIRLQEVEKVLEEKENEILRYLKISSKYKPKQINLSYIEQNINSQTMEDQTVRPYATANSDVDNPKLISDSNWHPTLVLKSENGQADQGAQPLSGLLSYSKQNAEAYAYTKVSAGVAYTKFGDDSKNGEEGSPVVIKKKTTHCTSMINTEMILMDGIQKEVPCYGAKKEAQACVSPDCLGVNRSTSKWRKHTQSISSSGDLIVVGADGRGGKVKVLKDRDEYLGVSMMVDSKRQKSGAKQGSQFNIEHFFEKTQTR